MPGGDLLQEVLTPAVKEASLTLSAFAILALLGCAPTPAKRVSHATAPPVSDRAAETGTEAGPPPRRFTTKVISLPSPKERWIRFDRSSPFGRVLVVDEGDLRYLRFGSPVGDDQSVISLTDSGAAPMECIRHALLGALMTAHHRRALLIGLGGGSFSSLLLRVNAQLRVDAVEINPVVVAAARRFFGVKEGPRLRVHVADGATFVHKQAARAAYDIIMLDAYGEEAEPPAQLITRAFYQRIRSRLAPGGVAILNLSVPTEVEQQLERRFRSVFQSCGCIRGRVDANQVVFCSDRPLPDSAELIRRAGKLSGLSFSLQRLVPRLQFDRCRSAEHDAQTGPRTSGD